jgi:hypothetical protein
MDRAGAGGHPPGEGRGPADQRIRGWAPTFAGSGRGEAVGMGLKHFVLAGLMLCAAIPVPAQQTASSTPDPIAERIDRYRFAPRSVGTYRALAGLGDPMAESNDGSYFYRSYSPDERAWLRQMLPGQSSTEASYWYPRPGDCRIDHALDTIKARVARLGRDHPYFAQWLRVQRAVFGACNMERWRQSAEERNRSAPPITLPRAMTLDDPALARLQRDDRAYQAASLLFYRRDPGARAAFRAIARSGSPHAQIARYMTVAIDARELDEYIPDRDADTRNARDARARTALAGAEAILADPALADIHPLAQGLIGYLGYWTGTPETRTAQVDATLDALEAPIARIRTDPVARDRYERAASDVDRLHGEFEDEAWWLTGAIPEDMNASRAMAAEARTRPMAAWLLFPRSPFERAPWAVADRFERPWGLLDNYATEQAGRESGAAWKTINASLATRYEPERWAEIDALTAAARHDGTGAQLAAVATRFYHQVRAALMYSDTDARPEAFAQVLGHLETWPWRDSRHFRELTADALQYLIEEGRIDEAHTLRDRGLVSRDRYEANGPALLLLARDEDELVREIAAMPDTGQTLLNLLSVDALTRLSARAELPAAIRARFARVAWSRLYALQRRIPRALDRQMRALNPEITAGWASRPGARPTDKRLLLGVLRSPGLNILITSTQRGPTPDPNNWPEDPGLTSIDVFQHSDNNWWCAWQPDRHSFTAAATLYTSFFAPEDYESRDPLAAAGAPMALGPLLRQSWLWRAQDPAEQEALAQIPSAPQLLAERAVAWRGGPAGQDEALALAVRATRYGCQRQGGHGAWSRAAFELLHQRFANSEAARRTRYWFDCAHFTYGCRPRTRDDEVWWRSWRWGY